MRVPLNWLRDYVDVDLEPSDLAERLTVLGMEVKGVERWGADWQNVVVGELLAVERHPRADRLSLTRVAVGDGSEPLEIVCGATNIAAGQRVPVALPGAVLPGGRRIERADKMGVVSNGMLCSGEELGLTADGEGILILAAGAPLGEALTDLYGDWVLDVDVKPNRGDALSLVGLAREVAVATGRSIADVRFPDCSVAEGDDRVESRLTVEVADAALCPRFVGRWVSGVRVGPSPDRVQMRLLAAGMRPVSNVVDASNYVMVELGKPIHTFDAGSVATDPDGRARLVVRVARAGERLETLDHVVRELSDETLLIADAQKPLAIAGVMGGASSEVSDATTNVIVESAIFDPVSIRRTAFRYALRSEASLRFEKGQEPALARLGADRTARLVREWGGGTVAVGRVDSAPDEPGPLRVTFRPGRVNRLLGTDLAADAQRTLLERVGVATEDAPQASVVTVATVPELVVVDPVPGEGVDALVPPWRRDIAIEADVAEEIARLHGYEHVPPVTPDTPMPRYRPNPLEARDGVREALAAAGLHEVATYALVAPDELDTFPLLPDVGVPPGEEAAGGRPIRVTNPLSSQHSVLRQRLLPSLLRVLSFNERQGREDVAIFEIGKGYGADGDATREWWRLSLLLAGRLRPDHWSDASRTWDLDDAKGLAERVASALGLEPPTYAPLRDDESLHPGRAATARSGSDAGPDLAGRIGELHPGLLAELDVRADRVVVAELAVRGLSGGTLQPVQVVAPSRYPAVERDLAIVVRESVTAGDVAASIREHGGALLADVRLFDVYRGASIGDGEKSLAHRLLFRADRTLTEDEVDGAIASVVAGLAQDVGGRVRT
jgi:phenylalanyl-tRNA synthetase beta chain